MARNQGQAVDGAVKSVVRRESKFLSLYHTWMKIGHALGRINSRIILGSLFYVIVLPMGLIMRLLDKDPMNRKFDRSIMSYRTRSVSYPKDQLEKPL